MPAVVYDLEFEQGATFSFEIEWREDDESVPPAGPLISTNDYDAHMQLRQKPGGDVFATFTSTTDDPEITLVGGIISVRVGADKTGLLTKGGVYDLELHNQNDATDVIRLIKGKFSVSLEVTDD